MYATNNMQIEFSTPNPKSNSKFKIQNYKEIVLIVVDLPGHDKVG